MTLSSTVGVAAATALANLRALALNPAPVPLKRGHCYENAAWTARANPEWRIVHGIVTGRGQIAGIQHGHAWLEREINGTTWVHDPSYRVTWTADRYYREGGVTYAVTYSLEEVISILKERLTWGPWDERIAATEHEPGKSEASH